MRRRVAGSPRALDAVSTRLLRRRCRLDMVSSIARSWSSVAPTAQRCSMPLRRGGSVLIVRTPTVRHLVAAGLALTFAPAVGRAAQQADAAAPPKQTAWTPPRTPWGDPDLQGIWPSGEMTGVPLQRPERFGERAVVTDEEFAERQAQLVRSYEFPPSTTTGWRSINRRATS